MSVKKVAEKRIAETWASASRNQWDGRPPKQTSIGVSSYAQVYLSMSIIDYRSSIIDYRLCMMMIIYHAKSNELIKMETRNENQAEFSLSLSLTLSHSHCLSLAVSLSLSLCLSDETIQAYAYHLQGLSFLVQSSLSHTHSLLTHSLKMCLIFFWIPLMMTMMMMTIYDHNLWWQFLRQMTGQSHPSHSHPSQPSIPISYEYGS